MDDDDDSAPEMKEVQHVQYSTASFINQHLRRTIGFGVSAPAVTYKEKKMIQLVRHEHSRKRFTIFSEEPQERNHVDANIIEEYAELLCEANADLDTQSRSRTVLKKHLTTVVQEVEKLYSSSRTARLPIRTVKAKTMKHAERILADMNEKIQNYHELQEHVDDEVEHECAQNSANISFPLEIQKDQFFKGMSKDQEAAGEFLLKKLQKQRK